tara:strand:- start:1920 stop:2177 length:258 start_codon:yes stop_codon:yes gene_type:complete
MSGELPLFISDLLSTTAKRTEKSLDGHHGKALIAALKAQGICTVRNTAGPHRNNINATLTSKQATFTVTESTCMGAFTSVVMIRH